MEDQPAQQAFDAIMDLMRLLSAERKMTDEEHSKAMKAARDLIPLINAERYN